MKAQLKTRIAAEWKGNPGGFYLAIKDRHCYAVGVAEGGLQDPRCRSWADFIEKGCTIYFSNDSSVIRFFGEDIPPEELAKLQLAVTEVLK